MAAGRQTKDINPPEARRLSRDDIKGLFSIFCSWNALSEKTHLGCKIHGRMNLMDFPV
jgi:hypothetical protein